MGRSVFVEFGRYNPTSSIRGYCSASGQSGLCIASETVVQKHYEPSAARLRNKKLLTYYFLLRLADENKLHDTTISSPASADHFITLYKTKFEGSSHEAGKLI